MQAHRVLASIVIACLAGCSQSHDAPNAVASMSPAPAGKTYETGIACPSREFDQFLTAFVSDSKVQTAFTASPLQSDSIDAGSEPEPKTVKRQLLASEVKFPVIQAAQQQHDEGLTMLRRKDGEEMVVTVTKPDTDYQISYYFRKNEGCWQLYRKFDESI